MTDRSKIMAGFANLEADLKRHYGKRVKESADPASDVLAWVVGGHEAFIALDEAERAATEPIEISVDESIGHVE